MKTLRKVLADMRVKANTRFIPSVLLIIALATSAGAQNVWQSPTGFIPSNGLAPTLTAGCNGAGASVAAGSTNNRGQFTTQTAAATTCTLTFNGTLPQAPFCVFVDGQARITPAAYSAGATTTTTAVVDFAAASNAVINYMCE